MAFSTIEQDTRVVISPGERVDSNLRVLHVLEATLGAPVDATGTSLSVIAIDLTARWRPAHAARLTDS